MPDLRGLMTIFEPYVSAGFSARDSSKPGFEQSERAKYQMNKPSVNIYILYIYNTQYFRGC